MKKQTIVSRLIGKTNGRIFSVTFMKKDGTERIMHARTGVTKHLKGGSLAFEPSDYSLKAVFDVGKQAYRMVNLATVTSFRCGKLQWADRS